MVRRRRDKKPANVAGERVRFSLFDRRVRILPVTVSSENAIISVVMGGVDGGGSWDWVA